jgi:hypothetical protein
MAGPSDARPDGGLVEKMHVSRTNVFDSINQRIFEFVRRSANRRLMPGTGAFSTPFRGELFGLTDAGAVARELRTRRVDALWLGSNPNVPRSISNILDPQCREGVFPEFKRQINSGKFSSVRWDERGNPSPDWNPIQEPKGRWRVYRDILVRRFGTVDCVAMANCIPWGSKNTREFLVKLDAANPGLLRRALQFADDLNAEIIRAVNPKLMLVPLSFGNEPRLDRVHSFGVAMTQRNDCRERHVMIDQEPFRFFVATYRRGAVTVPVIYLRHPTSLYITREAARRLIERVPKVLSEFW